MNALCSLITHANRYLGRMTAWLCLGLVILQVVIVLNRYCFGYGSLLGLDMINYEEALLYAFSAIFLLGSAYTYLDDGHVRVDIFYEPMTQRKKDKVDIAGNIVLLLPLMLLLLIKSNRNLDLAWSTAEGSVDGGLPYVYLWQSLLPVFAISMAAQGIANAARLSIDLVQNKCLADQLWSGAALVAFALLSWVSTNWQMDPGWTQPEPEWRFTAYVLGVWFVRLSSIAICLWCLATIFGFTQKLEKTEA